MSDFTAEFQELAEIYREAESLLNSIPIYDLSDTGAFADSILRQRDCLANIQRMKVKVDQLCDSWEKVESQLDSQSRNETLSAMTDAKTEALKLKRVCENRAQTVEAARDRLGAELGIIGKRSRHLKSLQPVKNNYPKFIDSHC
jgi:hypothetical protein